jgi:serine/threonine protein kinase
VDDSLKCKVCDFGLSRILDTADINTLTACGTPCWAAPEVLRSERYTEKADVFSYGIVMWECFAREVPYNGLLPFQIIHAVGTQGKRPDMPPGTPAQAARLIRRCWDEAAASRPDFDEVIADLLQLADPNWICPPVRAPA